MKKRRLLLVVLLPLFLYVDAAHTQTRTNARRPRSSRPVCRKQPDMSAGAIAAADGCTLHFNGCDRKDVKMRRPGLDYRAMNGGRIMTVANFYEFVCPLDVGVPTKARVPATVAMESEKQLVRIRGHLLAAKFEPDNDIHLQMGDSAEWEQDQLVIEIPPGQNYCEARENLMELYRADGGNRPGGYKFKTPPLVEVTGYLFLDSAHMLARRRDYCSQSGGRGFKAGLPQTMVRGIWEVHPVLTLKKVGR